MKKSLLTLALAAASLTSFATDYTGAISATLASNTAEADNVTVSIEASGESYTVTIKQFTTTISNINVTVGPVVYENVSKDGDTYTGSLSDATIASVPLLGNLTLSRMDLTATERNGGLTLTSSGTANLFGTENAACEFTFIAPETETGGDEQLGEGVYFFEDFEWMAPWAEKGNGSPAGKTVETDDPNANAPQLATPKIDDVSAYQAILNKGYQIIKTNVAGKTAREPEAQTYLQSNYLKFGLTSYYSGIIFPINADIPADKATKLTFDWCSMRQGSGKWDPTEIVVIVNYNGNETQYPIEAWNYENGAAYAWKEAKVDIPAGKIGNGATITIRNCDNQWPGTGALRWFLDNVKLFDATTNAIIGDVIADEVIDENAPVEYFNIQGVRVNGDNLPAGLYIRRQGTKAAKILVR